MHGPEHHFLVPAVLLAAYYNEIGDKDQKSVKISGARQRANKTLGGFCGSHGACSAAIGAGIFTSLVTNATTLSGIEWKLSNLATSKCLAKIASYGGPRCCKRSTFLTILNAADFSTKYLDVEMHPDREIVCQFADMNNECIGKNCPFNRSPD